MLISLFLNLDFRKKDSCIMHTSLAQIYFHLIRMQATHIVIMFLHNWFIKSCCLLVFIFLHKQHMGNIKLPCLMLITKFHRFPENLFHLSIVLQIPVDFFFFLQHRYVPRIYRKKKVVYKNCEVVTSNNITSFYTKR